MRAWVHCGQQRRCAEEAGVKETETIMEILAAYDLTHSFRDAAGWLAAHRTQSFATYMHAMRASYGPRRSTAVS